MAGLTGGRTRRALEVRRDTLGRGKQDTHPFAAEKLEENINPGHVVESGQRVKVVLLLKVFLD